VNEEALALALALPPTPTIITLAAPLIKHVQFLFYLSSSDVGKVPHSLTTEAPKHTEYQNLFLVFR
jgi:hypothetical protein